MSASSDPREYALDRDLAGWLEGIRERGVPPIWEVTPEQARAGFLLRTKAMLGLEVPPAVAAVSERGIPGPAGELRVRVYRPRPDAAPPGPLPTVLYVHGGGHVICDLDTHDAVCRHLALDAEAVVVSLDYRLAPEHPFPAAVEDTLAAARWVRGQVTAGALGGAPAWGMAGDSAGANLSAVAAHLLRDDAASGVAGAGDGPAMAAQLLIYGTFDIAGEYDSHERLAEGYGLEWRSVEWFVEHYLGGSGVGREDPRMSPLRFVTHAGLPATIVTGAGFDPLVDEARAYAAALRAAGVHVEYQEAPTMMHGFIDLGPLSPVAAQAFRAMGQRFGELLREQATV